MLVCVGLQRRTAMAEAPKKKKRNLAAERSQKVIYKNPCVGF